jgi:hypothetical protein
MEPKTNRGCFVFCLSEEDLNITKAPCWHVRAAAALAGPCGLPVPARRSPSPSLILSISHSQGPVRSAPPHLLAGTSLDRSASSLSLIGHWAGGRSPCLAACVRVLTECLSSVAVVCMAGAAPALQRETACQNITLCSKALFVL